MNRNMRLNPQYVYQQDAIKETCVGLGLVAFYPYYHADRTDKNTVLVYTREANDYNEKLPPWVPSSDYKPYVCFFENTDANGLYDLNWMNHGTIDCRTNAREKIRDFIISQYLEYQKKHKTATEKKTCGILSSDGGRDLRIHEPNDEVVKIDFSKVSPEFKRDFMEAWRKFYDAEAESDNAGINGLSVLDEMGYCLNTGEVFCNKDTFEKAYERIVKLMFPD